MGTSARRHRKTIQTVTITVYPVAVRHLSNQRKNQNFPLWIRSFDLSALRSQLSALRSRTVEPHHENRRISRFGTASANDCVKNSWATLISLAYFP